MIATKLKNYLDDNDIKYVLKVGSFSIKYILPGLLPDHDTDDIIDALHDDIPDMFGKLEEVLVALLVLGHEDDGRGRLVDLVLEVAIMAPVADLPGQLTQQEPDIHSVVGIVTLL